MRFRGTPAILAAAVFLVPVLGAQRVPKRPKLDAAGDTNNATAYYQFGLDHLNDRGPDAATAFYWSSRIDPRNAAPLYARRIAWFYQSPRRFFDYARNPRRYAKDPEVMALDSLYMKALFRDPFIPTRLDPLLMRMIRRELFAAGVDLAPSGQPSEVAWYAMMDGDYQTAVDAYAKAIQKNPRDEDLHAERGKALYYLGRYDSAAVELNEAVKQMTEREDKKTILVYASKAMYEYLAGHALLVAGNAEGAREAFQRAAAEDLSFYMAHVRLAAIAQELGDTAAASTEYDMAVQLRGDDPILRFDYGTYLMKIGRYDDAAEQFAKAAEAEPFYAPTYLWQALLAETNGDLPAAKQALERYVALTPRNDPKLPQATKRLEELRRAP